MKKFLLKIVKFYNFRKICLLDGLVFVIVRLKSVSPQLTHSVGKQSATVRGPLTHSASRLFLTTFISVVTVLKESLLFLCPPSEGVGGHIVFGVDPVGVGVSVGVSIGVGGVAFCLHNIS